MVKFTVVRADAHDRPVRVSVPVRASFAGDTFLISEFTANLSVGGIFLPTENAVVPHTEGELTFRASQWDEPFTIRARVVRNVPANTPGMQAGLGIQFLDIETPVKRKLENLVGGIQDGSVVAGIRRSIREGGGSILEKIRKRPIDQRVMLAIQANTEEIDALLRDGNPAVIERLFENPRLNIRHVRLLTRDPRLPARLMLTIKRQGSWLSDEETRSNYCMHPAAPVGEVLPLLDGLPVPRLRMIVSNGNVRRQISSRAKELIARRGAAGGRR